MGKLEKQHYLIIYNDNWADEMDIEGFEVMEEDEWKNFKAKLKAIKRSFNVCFGTNEDNEYSNGQQFLDNLEAKKISESEYKTLKKLFGGTFGHGFSDVLDYVEDDE